MLWCPGLVKRDAKKNLEVGSVKKLSAGMEKAAGAEPTPLNSIEVRGDQCLKKNRSQCKNRSDE